MRGLMWPWGGGREVISDVHYGWHKGRGRARTGRWEQLPSPPPSPPLSEKRECSDSWRGERPFAFAWGPTRPTTRPALAHRKRQHGSRADPTLLFCRRIPMFDTRERENLFNLLIRRGCCEQDLQVGSCAWVEAGRALGYRTAGLLPSLACGVRAVSSEDPPPTRRRKGFPIVSACTKKEVHTACTAGGGRGGGGGTAPISARSAQR